MAVIIAVTGSVAAENYIFTVAFCDLSKGGGYDGRTVLDSFLIGCVILFILRSVRSELGGIIVCVRHNNKIKRIFKYR